MNLLLFLFIIAITLFPVSLVLKYQDRNWLHTTDKNTYMLEVCKLQPLQPIDTVLLFVVKQKCLFQVPY